MSKYQITRYSGGDDPGRYRYKETYESKQDANEKATELNNKSTFFFWKVERIGGIPSFVFFVGFFLLIISCLVFFAS